jgi:arylsulfatase A-like enzyme
LHHLELSNWFAAAGDAFRVGYESSLPMGIIDILPTVLTVLGVKIPGSVQGRVLRETLVEHADPLLPEVFQKTFTAEYQNDHRAHLSITYVGSTYYLERGWVD